MKQHTFSLRQANYCSTRSKYTSFISMTLILLLGLMQSAKAQQTMTHIIDDNFKGYSIDKLRDLNQPFVDVYNYFAAGTYYDNVNNRVGYHFINMKNDGTIVSSTVAYLPGYETRVVDIVAVNSDAIWITLQVRDLAAQKDFIYAEKVTSTGSLGAGVNHVAIQPNGSMQQTYQNIYPTHSLYKDDALYICGYVSNQVPSTTIPTNTSLEKYGAIFKADLTVMPAAVSEYVWDSPDNNFFDYDMALKMKFAKKSVTGYTELILTGAMNSGIGPNDPSGVLAMRVVDDPFSGLASFFNGLVLTGWPAYPGPTDHGIYGIDVIETNDYNLFFLTNLFQNNYVMRWGFTRTDISLGVDVTRNSFAGIGAGYYDDWAMQAFVSDNSQGYFHDVTVLGLAADLYANCNNTMQNPSSVTNVNPFVGKYSLGWAPLAPPVGIQLSQNPNGHVIHESNQGTSAAQLDYLTASATVSNTDLENIQRLHTPAIEYDKASGDYAYIAPLSSPDPSNPNVKLNTKFMHLAGMGLSSCVPYTVCDPNIFLSTIQTTQPFTTPTYNIYDGLLLTFNRNTEAYTNVDDCAGGYYKTTGIESFSELGDISIFPNPASSELVLNLGTSEGEYSFVLTDITGREVMAKKGAAANTVTIQLSDISAGVYVATIHVDGRTHTEKLIIE